MTLPHPLLFPEGKCYAVIAEDVERRCVGWRIWHVVERLSTSCSECTR